MISPFPPWLQKKIPKCHLKVTAENLVLDFFTRLSPLKENRQKLILTIPSSPSSSKLQKFKILN